MLYGEFGEDFAVKLDAFFLLNIDESRIGETVFAKCIVETDNPEASKRALLGASVAVGVFARLHDSFFGGAVVCLAAPAETGCHLENVLSSFIGGDTALDSWHKSTF